jgi:hypothetical protein
VGFDITFHPISVEDAQYFVFDVVDDPSLSEERLASLTRMPEKQAIARASYGCLLRWRNPRDWGQGQNFGNTVAFVTAAVAGFLCPFWYSRSGAISFHDKRDDRVLRLFRSWTQLARGAVSRMPDKTDGLLLASYHGSGLIVPERLTELESIALDIGRSIQDETYHDDPVAVVPEGFPPVRMSRAFDDDGLASLLTAIEYAKKHDLGLVEASDVVKPIADETCTDPEHFRDSENLRDFATYREA